VAAMVAAARYAAAVTTMLATLRFAILHPGWGAALGDGSGSLREQRDGEQQAQDDCEQQAFHGCSSCAELTRW